jgi:hypothetical protein
VAVVASACTLTPSQARTLAVHAHRRDALAACPKRAVDAIADEDLERSGYRVTVLPACCEPEALCDRRNTYFVSKRTGAVSYDVR